MRRLFRGIRKKFIAIYLLLGLLPLLAISYHSFRTSAATLERLSSQQLSNLTTKTASQISTQLGGIRKDIELLSNYPFIQLAFLQFSFGQRLETVKLKLQKYKSQNPLFARISLISLQGEVILTLPAGENEQGRSNLDLVRLQKAAGEDLFVSEVLRDHPDGAMILFSKRVYDFENLSNPVGLLVFSIPLAELTRYAEELDPAPGTIGFVYDRAQDVVLHNPPLPLDPRPFIGPPGSEHQVHIEEGGGFRLFIAEIPERQWSIGLLLPEEALLGNIIALKTKNLTVAATVAVLALLSTLFFVRRITDPLAQLTRGAQEFSTGNLDHRIVIRGESELRSLGEEFNAMAARLKARERQIRQVDRLASLGILAAGVAHEVRNPLAGIKSCAQLMERKAIAPGIAELAQGIDEEIDRLDRIVRDLLDFARPGEPSPRWLELSEVLDKVLEMTRKSLQEGGVTIQTDYEAVPAVWADPDQVRQILLNLILNSANATPSGGHLRLRIDGEGEKVALTVADTGCGIPREHLDRIFDPFFTLSPGGTGLGLSVAYSLMKENGIGFQVESVPEEGTVFHLYFNQAKGAAS